MLLRQSAKRHRVCLNLLIREVPRQLGVSNLALRAYSSSLAAAAAFQELVRSNDPKPERSPHNEPMSPCPQSKSLGLRCQSMAAQAKQSPSKRELLSGLQNHTLHWGKSSNRGKTVIEPRQNLESFLNLAPGHLHCLEGS